MENKFFNIGYIGWTEDAAALAAATAEKHKDKRTQYALCPAGTQLPEYVQAVASAAELAELCKLLVLIEGSDAAVLEGMDGIADSVCADFTLALPTEKYRRAMAWEAKGGFYVDAATEQPLTQLLETQYPRYFLSGRCSQIVVLAFLSVLFPVYVPGEAGEATLLRLLRTTPAGTLCELLNYINHFRKTCPGPEVPALTADVPENQGVINAIKRAKQMSDTLWQPVKPYPKVIGHNESDDFSPEFPAVGLPYSSARLGETFIGVNVPYEGFFTALEEENSVLYTKDRRKDGNAAAWYGSVCSVLVGNALDLPTRAACKNWPTVPGMRLIEPRTVDNLKLGDMLLSTGHVVIITAIDRTAVGKVYQAEITEATHPCCKRQMRRADELANYYFKATDFKIYRYDYIADVPYTPCAYTPLEGEELTAEKNEDLVLLLGNGVNCNFGEALTFRIKTAGWENLRIACNGKVVATVPLTGAEEFVTYTPDTCGDYTAVCVKDGTASKAAEFTVVNCRVTTEKTAYAPGETIAATFRDDSGAKAISFALMESATSATLLIRNLNQTEQESGKCTLTCDAPGEYHLRVFFRNRYGLYRVDYPGIQIGQEKK